DRHPFSRHDRGRASCCQSRGHCRRSRPHRRFVEALLAEDQTASATMAAHLRSPGADHTAGGLSGGQLMSVAYEQQAATALQQLGLAIAEKQLDQAAQQAAAAGWSYTHFLGYLLDAELRFRHEKTVRLNLMFANLPYQKRLDTFDFHQQPSIDKRLIDELATGRFLHQGRNVVFLGPPGVGKTHLAIALGVLTA